MLDPQQVFSPEGRAHGPAQYAAPLLNAMLEQARRADETRSLDPDLIAAIKQNDIMRMSASPEIAGLNESIVAIGNELRDIAAHCTSTAWCLWNHLCTFQHFAGVLGPKNIDFLGDLVSKREWVCFPAGAATHVKGAPAGDKTVLNGVAAFGSGARYAEWAGVVFNEEGNAPPFFALADLRDPNVRIDPTWDGMSLRASATDHIHYEGAEVPSARVAPWPPKYREPFRDPERPMIHQRYREDWVALSVLWLGCMATGVAEVSLAETAEGIRDRIAIMGVKMADRPTVHVNLGRAQALIHGATDTVYAAMAETDARIEAGVMPTEADYFRQTAAGMQAVHNCQDAMTLILRVLGGNGLREGTDFERRYRDFQAMPLHINGHIDRITEQLGRLTLGLETQNPF